MPERDERKWCTLTFKLPHEIAVSWTRASELAQITGKANSVPEQFEAVCVTATQEWLTEATVAAFRHGSTTRGDFDAYEFREAVRERDGYRCVLCGSTKVDVAHIVPRSADSTRKLDVTNAVCLCRACHELTGPSWVAYQQQFEAIVKKNTAAPLWRFGGQT